MQQVNGSGSLELDIVEMLLAMPQQIHCRSVYPATLLVVAHGVVANELKVFHKSSKGSVLQRSQLLSHTLAGHRVLDDVEVVGGNVLSDRGAKKTLWILLLKEADDLLQSLKMLLLSC